MHQRFKYERNDPCPCGSLKKFKKCCQSAVEEAMDSFDSHWKNRFPVMANVLSLACGLRAREGEVVPPAEKINELFNNFLNNIQAYGENTSRANLEFTRHINTLEEFFYNDSKLQEMLFPLDAIKNFMGEIESAVAEVGEEDEKFQSKFYVLAGKYLPGLVNDELKEMMAMTMLEFMRGQDRDDRELESFIVGIIHILDENVAGNPFWEMMLKVSWKLNSRGVAEMKELMGNLETGKEESERLLNEFLERNPVMKRHWSKKAWENAVPAIKAILNGGLDLDMPFYAVITSFVKMAQQVEKVKTKVSGQSTGEWILNKMYYDNDEHARQFYRLAVGSIVMDSSIFVYCIYNYFDDLIKREELPAEYRDSVMSLLMYFGVDLVDRENVIELLYLSAIRRLLTALPISLPEIEGLPSVTLDWESLNSRETLENYAAYLENCEEKEGAAHVRNVAAYITG